MSGGIHWQPPSEDAQETEQVPQAPPDIGPEPTGSLPAPNRGDEERSTSTTGAGEVPSAAWKGESAKALSLEQERGRLRSALGRSSKPLLVGAAVAALALGGIIGFAGAQGSVDEERDEVKELRATLRETEADA